MPDVPLSLACHLEVGREDWPTGRGGLGRLQLASSHFQWCHGSRDLGSLKYGWKMTGAAGGRIWLVHFQMGSGTNAQSVAAI